MELEFQKIGALNTILFKTKCFLFSLGIFITFGPSQYYYYFYRISRAVAKYGLGLGGDALTKSSLEGVEVMIEGFRHSGNSFLLGSLGNHSNAVASHYHRIWRLRQAVNARIPVILVIRDPLESALSRHYRTTSKSSSGGSLPVAPWAAIGCWLIYYRLAWRYRASVCIVPFSQLVNHYERTAELIRTRFGIELGPPAPIDRQNRFFGDRTPVKIGFFTRKVLEAARRLYDAYLQESNERFLHK